MAQFFFSFFPGRPQVGPLELTLSLSLSLSWSSRVDFRKFLVPLSIDLKKRCVRRLPKSFRCLVFDKVLYCNADNQTRCVSILRELLKDPIQEVALVRSTLTDGSLLNLPFKIARTRACFLIYKTNLCSFHLPNDDVANLVFPSFTLVVIIITAYLRSLFCSRWLPNTALWWSWCWASQH